MTLSLLVSLAWSQDTADLSQEGWSGEAAPSVTSLEYVVGHGDKINVIVVGEPDLSATDMVVSADGSVNLPIVGRVVVKGRSAQDIEGQLTRLLAKDYLVSPQVSVKIVEFNSQRVEVLPWLAGSRRRPLRRCGSPVGPRLSP